MVADVNGLHAQVLSSADLAAWARVADLEPDALATALWEERSLVKSWAMRGTIHLLPARDYGLWLGGLGTYRHYLQPAWSRAFGITPEDLDRVVAAVAEALDGRCLTRQELAAEVESRTGSGGLGRKLADSWGATLKPATYRGVLCFGPSRGRNVTFARPDRWLGDGLEAVPGDQAMSEIVRRFLAVNGPASREELARWWAMSPAEAGRRLRALGAEVTEVDVEGRPLWMLVADLAEAEAAEAPGAVRLLPAFDQYVVSCTKSARHLLPGPFRDRIYRAQGWLSPVLLVDGLMAGTWQHERKGEALVVTIEPFVELEAWAIQAAEAEAAALGVFLGAEAEVGWVPAPGGARSTGGR